MNEYAIRKFTTFLLKCIFVLSSSRRPNYSCLPFLLKQAWRQRVPGEWQWLTSALKVPHSVPLFMLPLSVCQLLVLGLVPWYAIMAATAPAISFSLHYV